MKRRCVDWRRPSRRWRVPKVWKLMPAPWRCASMPARRQPIPKGAPRPRRAVLDMAPYSPPTGNRLGKMRLDFNENTVGCSPRVIEFLKQRLNPEQLAVYPDYTEVRPALETFFHVEPGQLLLT